MQLDDTTRPHLGEFANAFPLSGDNFVTVAELPPSHGAVELLDLLEAVQFAYDFSVAMAAYQAEHRTGTGEPDYAEI